MIKLHKKFITLVLAGAMTFTGVSVFTGCGNKEESTKQETTVDAASEAESTETSENSLIPKKLENKDEGFSICVAKHWNEDKDRAASENLLVAGSEPEFNQILSCSKEENSSEANLAAAGSDELSLVFKTKMEQEGIEDLEINDGESIEICGNKAVKWTVLGSKDGKRIAKYVVWIPVESNLYKIEIGCGEADFKVNKFLYDEIIKSIKM